MSLATNLQDLATRVATECKSLRTLINGNSAGLSALTTTAKNNLVAAINELDAELATISPTLALNDLTDVAITAPAGGHIVRHDGVQWVNVDASTLYQAADADLTAIAGLTTTAYGRDLLTLANQAALMGLLAAASELSPGIVELATVAEAQAGTDTARAVTPVGVKAVVDAATNALVDAAPGTLDTLNEIAAALGDDPNFATTITNALAVRVRVDAAQAFTAPQQLQGRQNIDAASATDVGDTTTNFVTTFEAGLV